MITTARVVRIGQWLWQVDPDEGMAVASPVLFFLAITLAPGFGGAWVVALAAIQLVYFFTRPTIERAIWFLLAYLFSIGGAQLAIYSSELRSVPPWMNWLSYLVIPVAAGLALLPRRRWRAVACLQPMLFLVGVGALSGFLRGVSVADWLGWCLHHLRYPLLFVALLTSHVPLRTYHRWISAFIILATIQIPATAVQFLASGGDFGSDQTVGTMIGAQTGLMGLTVIVAFFSALAGALLQGGTPSRVAGTLVFLVPLLLGGSGFPTAVGGLLGVYLLARWGISLLEHRTQQSLAVHVKRQFVLLAGMSFVAGTVLLWAVLSLYPKGNLELADWLTGNNPSLTSAAAFTRPEVAEPSSRQQFIAMALAWFHAHPEDLPLGTVGPRLGLSDQGSAFASTLGETAQEPVLTPVMEALGLNPQLPIFSVQLPRTLFEVGVIGLIGFLWLFWEALRGSRRTVRAAGARSWVGAQALAFEAIWLLYVVLGVLYMDIWRVDQPSFAFWLWAALLYRAGQGGCSEDVAPDRC